MFENYTQMMQGQDPEAMKKLMLSQFLMGGGAAMANAGAQGGRGSFGRSLAAGMMGGMQGANDVFGLALKQQSMSNERNRLDKQHADSMKMAEDRLALSQKQLQQQGEQFTSKEKSDREYQKAYLEIMRQKMMMNPFAAMMGGDPTAMPPMAPETPVAEPSTNPLDAPSGTEALKMAKEQTIAQQAAEAMAKKQQVKLDDAVAYSRMTPEQVKALPADRREAMYKTLNDAYASMPVTPGGYGGKAQALQLMQLIESMR